MSKNLNISVLVAARDEYIEQLKCILCPLINQGFLSIYNDAYGITNGKNTIYKFQELLKAIPTWNQTILQNESKRIKKKCPYIMDIVTAIFVSNVKILASIRLSGDNDNIRVKIPTSDLFIHSIYIESANCIFYDPFLFYHRAKNYGEIQKNKELINNIIRTAINETIRQMLPFDNILQEYLKSALDDNISESSDSESSDSDSENNININKIVNQQGESEDSDHEIDSEPESEYDPEYKNLSLEKGGNNTNNTNSFFNEDPVQQEQPVFEQPQQVFQQPQQIFEQPQPVYKQPEQPVFQQQPVQEQEQQNLKKYSFF